MEYAKPHHFMLCLSIHPRPRLRTGLGYKLTPITVLRPRRQAHGAFVVAGS